MLAKSTIVYDMHHKVSKKYPPDESELVPTPPDVKRPACPKCQADIYVRPFLTGLINPDEKLWNDIESGRISVEFTCHVDTWWEWDCVKCRVRFSHDAA